MAARRGSYTEALAAKVLTFIQGGMSLSETCRQDGMPHRDTVHKWIREVDGFADRYARASEDRADAIFDEMFEIADDASNDWMERNNPDGTTGDAVMNGEHVQRSKLRIETRKWALAKMKPKKYGDKLDLNHGASDGFSDAMKALMGNNDAQ